MRLKKLAKLCALEEGDPKPAFNRAAEPIAPEAVLAGSGFTILVLPRSAPSVIFRSSAGNMPKKETRG
jgi:hypothetical protein